MKGRSSQLAWLLLFAFVNSTHLGFCQAASPKSEAPSQLTTQKIPSSTTIKVEMATIDPLSNNTPLESNTLQDTGNSTKKNQEFEMQIQPARNVSLPEAKQTLKASPDEKEFLVLPSGSHQTHNILRESAMKNTSSRSLSRRGLRNEMQMSLKSKAGNIRWSGSSSSPVEPIQPLLNLGADNSESLTLPPIPVFDDGAPKNISGLKGNTAYIHCLVHNLGNRSVSWIRQRDLHILTVGRYTYTTDQRFEVIHKNGSKDWILKIKYAQVRDSGNYECQLSTKPIRSYTVNLKVYAPKAEIIGAPDMHVDRGSTINLTCVIENSPAPPAYIFWYHNGNVVNYDSPRGGITVVTERGNTTRGYLLIQDAKSTDSGNYSCEPSNTSKTPLRVHVLDGELPAGLQSSSLGPQKNISCLILIIIALIFYNKLRNNYFMTANDSPCIDKYVNIKI